jgi:hypothetical protein
MWWISYYCGAGVVFKLILGTERRQAMYDHEQAVVVVLFCLVLTRREALRAETPNYKQEIKNEMGLRMEEWRWRCENGTSDYPQRRTSGRVGIEREDGGKVVSSATVTESQFEGVNHG